MGVTKVQGSISGRRALLRWLSFSFCGIARGRLFSFQGGGNTGLASFALGRNMGRKTDVCVIRNMDNG